MANIELIKEVIALIEKDEEEHQGKHFDMSGWVVPPDDPELPAFCNTTMCLAGWSEIHRLGSMEEFLRQAVRRAGNQEEWQDWDTTDFVEDIEERAGEYLGFDRWQRTQVFYATHAGNTADLKKHITNVLEEVIWPGIEPGPFRKLRY